MRKKFSRGWTVACMLCCINALSISKRISKRQANFDLTNVGDALTGTDYDFEDVLPEKYADRVEESSVELLDLNRRSFRTTTTTGKPDRYVILTRVLEPDAEMLPAHYTGVQPPGVDHMEIAMMDSASQGSNTKNNLATGPITGFKSSARAAKVGEVSVGAKGEKNFVNKASFEKGKQDEKSKDNQKIEYAEAAGKKNSRMETKQHVKGAKEEKEERNSGNYETERHREKGHNAAGYHNVYHKDEYKKDANFYDNDHQGGRFHKHGHYDEKHVASEGDYRKGGSHDAAFAEAEAAKKGKSEKERVSEEAQGHVGKTGYEGFFGKLDGFAKSIGAAVGEAFGKEGAVKGR